MPTPAKGYRTKDGKRVPGVTTIIGAFKESEGLQWWANRLALTPLLEIHHMLSNGATDVETRQWAQRQDPEMWDHTIARRKAADAGTIAHEMVDCFVHSRDFDPEPYKPELVEMAKPAYGAFREWAALSNLQITETEKQLVSERYRFGGTRDAMLIGGKRSLGDWKSSKAVYPEMTCQLAAYGLLDEEAGNTIDGGFHLLRFSKQDKPDDPVHFVHHHWDQLDKGREAFLLMRQLYDLMADLKRLVK